MSIEVKGKAHLERFNCPNCSKQIRIQDDLNPSPCSDCGAKYEKYEADIDFDSGRITCKYEFVGFKCIEFRCKADCPSGLMFCEEHCSDDSIESWKNLIETSKKSIKSYEDRLEIAKESKKTWGIKELMDI